MSVTTLLTCGLTAQGTAFASPTPTPTPSPTSPSASGSAAVKDPGLFSDFGANAKAPAPAPVPAAVVDKVAKSKWKAPKDVNRKVKGGKPDKTKKWKYASSGATVAAAPAAGTSSRVAAPQAIAAATSSVDANIAAPGLGVQSFYGMQEFPIRNKLSLGVNVGNGNLVVRSQDQSNNAPGQAITNDRFFNSLSARVGAFGKGWSLSGGQDVGLEIGTSTIVFRGQSGFRASFTGSGSSWTAPSGLSATLTKNSDGSWKLVTTGSRNTMNFDSAGNLLSVKDRNGVGITYNYETGANGAQRAASVSDAAGRVTTYTYDSSDRIIAITDAANRKVSYGYNAAGYLESTLDALGNETSYTYDGNGRVTRIVTTMGVTTDVAYDTTGRVTSLTRYPQVNAGGTPEVTKFSYASGSTVETNPLGKAFTYTLDTQGRVTKVVDPMGVQKNQSWTATSMIASGWESDASAITSFSYEKNNMPTKVGMPTGSTNSASYSAGSCGASTTSGTSTDLAQCATDDAGNTTAFSYDSAGNQLSSTDTKATGGASVKKTYAKPGSTDISTNCSSFAGQLCSVTDGNGNVTRYLYDADGNMSKITPPNPLGVVTYQYDSLGRLTWAVKGSGVTNVYDYDVNDHLVQATYGATANNTETKQLRVYDADGNLHGIDGQVFDYDGESRLQKVTDPTGAVRWVSRDAAGNINVISDQNNVMTNYTYNASNQVTVAAWHGAACPTNGTGNTNLPSGCVTFAYTNGKLTTQYMPGNVSTTYTRDASNRITELKTTNNTSNTVMEDQVYNFYVGGTVSKANDRTNVQSMTDKVGDYFGANMTTTYTYDSQQRIVGAVEKTSAGATNASWAYTYDKDGNRLTQVMSGKLGAPTAGTRTFTYNAADELATVDGSTTNVSFDANGDSTANPGWLPGGVNSQSAMANTSTGDVASMTSGDGSTTYAFTNAQVLPTGTRNLTWAHDVSYTWNPVGLESYTSSNALGQVSLFTLPNGQTLGYQVNGKIEYFVKDRLGSTIALTTDAGAKDAYYRYDPYGQPRSYYRSSYEAMSNNLMYTGAPRDYATGLIRMGARWYDPTIGRFTQADPSGQETNPYAYADGNPVCKTDVTGLSADCAEELLEYGITSLAFIGTLSAGPETAGLSWALAATSLANLSEGYKAMYACLPSKQHPNRLG